MNGPEPRTNEARIYMLSWPGNTSFFSCCCHVCMWLRDPPLIFACRLIDSWYLVCVLEKVRQPESVWLPESRPLRAPVARAVCWPPSGCRRSRRPRSWAGGTRTKRSLRVCVFSGIACPLKLATLLDTRSCCDVCVEFSPRGRRTKTQPLSNRKRPQRAKNTRSILNTCLDTWFRTPTKKQAFSSCCCCTRSYSTLAGRVRLLVSFAPQPFFPTASNTGLPPESECCSSRGTLVSPHDGHKLSPLRCHDPRKHPGP